MSEIKQTPITDDTFIMGYKVGAGLHGTMEDANKAIRRGEGSSWIPLYRKHHCADDLLAALREGRRAIGEHFAPDDCYATGPVTGNDYRDLVECPACSFIAMYDAAIAKATGSQP